MNRRRRLGLWAAVLALAASAVLASMRPGDREIYPPRAGEQEVAVYVIDNGFHTDIALPAAPTLARGGPLAAAAGRLRGGEWIAVGWGDAAFYQGTGLSLARLLDGLRALFMPGNQAVLQVAAFDGAPDRAFARTMRVNLSQEGYERMAARIDASFTPGPLPVGRPQARSAFFESSEAFSILKLCNHWTGEVLNAAGLPTTGALHLMPAGLRLDLKLRAGLRDDQN